MIDSLVLLVALAASAVAGVDGADLRVRAKALAALESPEAVAGHLAREFTATARMTTRVDTPTLDGVSGSLARIAGGSDALRTEAVLVTARASGDATALALLPVLVRSLALRDEGPGRTVLVLASTGGGDRADLASVAAAIESPIVAVVAIEALEGAAGRPWIRCDASAGLQRTCLRARRDADISLWFVTRGRPREEPDPVEGVIIRPSREHAHRTTGPPSDASLGAVANFAVEVVRILAEGEEDPPLGQAGPADASASTGLLERAKRLAAARRFTEALGIAARALGREGQAASARLFRGRVLLELNRPAAARAEAEAALRLRPGEEGGLLLRGRASEAMGDEAAALADYETVIVRRSGSVEARARRGLLRVRRAQIKPALEDLEIALAADPDHPVALKGKGMALFYSREILKALAMFDRVVKRDPDDWEGWFYRGLVRIHRAAPRVTSPTLAARFRQSLADFTGAVTADPRQTLPYVYRGGVYLELGEYARARSDYDRALALGPETADLRFQRGIARLSLNEYDPAIEDFRRVVVLDPTISSAPYNIACAHARAGRPERAMEWLRSAVAAGFLDGSGNIDHMRADPDLYSLRARPDFRRLLKANRAD